MSDLKAKLAVSSKAIAAAVAVAVTQLGQEVTPVLQNAVGEVVTWLVTTVVVWLAPKNADPA